jgi:gas vesicle protein
MFFIIIGGIIGFAVGNVVGAIFAPKRIVQTMSQIRHRIDKARASAEAEAERTEQEIKKHYEQEKDN